MTQLPSSKYFRKQQQITDDHCGPAVIQMMLDLVDVHVTQEQIADAAGATPESLDKNGTTVEQLAQACEKIAPNFAIWQKQPSSLEEVQAILAKGYVVGVEWQGLFYDSEAEEEPGADYGHYSLMLQVNNEQQTVTIVDPYRDFQNSDRVFPISFFLRRWWDTNVYTDPTNGREMEVKDVNLAFFIAPKSAHFPEEMGFMRFHFSPGAPHSTKPPLLQPSLPSLEIRKQRIASFLKGKLRKIG